MRFETSSLPYSSYSRVSNPDDRNKDATTRDSARLFTAATSPVGEWRRMSRS